MNDVIRRGRQEPMLPGVTPAAALAACIRQDCEHFDSAECIRALPATLAAAGWQVTPMEAEPVERCKQCGEVSANRVHQNVDASYFHYFISERQVTRREEGLRAALERLLGAIDQWQAAWQTSSTGWGPVSEAKSEARAALAQRGGGAGVSTPMPIRPDPGKPEPGLSTWEFWIIAGIAYGIVAAMLLAAHPWQP